MKTYGGVDVYIHVFLTSALDGGGWSASCTGRSTPGERVPGTHWMCPDAKPGRRGGKPATNRLSYGTAKPVGNSKKLGMYPSMEEAPV
jgi:hypothetical protein